MNKKLILFTLLCLMFPINIFANEKPNFRILTEDKNGIPTTGIFTNNNAKAKTGVRVVDYVNKQESGLGTQVANDGYLIYARNGYGGGVSDPTKDSVLHQTSYSFNIMMPHDAMEDSLAKREHAFFNYIPYNRTYRAGPSGQSAYGYPRKYNYPNKANPYTLKLIQADPVTGVFDVDFSGNVPMVSMSKGKKPVFGEYRFNGVSGNGESLNNAFFPDDIANKVSTPDYGRHRAETFTARANSAKPFEGSMIGGATWENGTIHIAEHALTEVFDKLYIGGSAQAFRDHSFDYWNKRIKIDNSPKVGSATYTIYNGSNYRSFILGKNQISDIAIKSIVVFDVDEDGKLIKKDDGSFQTMGEFSRQENLISSQFGDFRVNAPLSAGKDYVIGLNLQNVKSLQTISIDFTDTSKIADHAYVNTYSVTIPEIEKNLKIPEEIKYVKDSEGEETNVRERIYGEWVSYADMFSFFDWSKISSNGYEYRPKIREYKMDDHRQNLDNLVFHSVPSKTNVAAEASIMAGGGNPEGNYDPDALIKAKGGGNAMLITAMIPYAPELNSNKDNDMGWLLLPIEVNDMGMDKMVVKDETGRIIPEGSSLDAGMKYYVDYVVKKVAGDKEVKDTTIDTVAKNIEGKSFTKVYPAYTHVNKEDMLKMGKPVNSKGEFELIRVPLPDEVVKVCGVIVQKHTDKGENIKNKNDTICQEFKGEQNDMSIVEIKLKDPATGKYVTQVSSGKNYEVITTVKKELGNKIVKTPTIDTTINGGSKATNSTDDLLLPNKTVDIVRTVQVPSNSDSFEFCSEIVKQHDINKDNIRNSGDRLCRSFGQLLNLYVQNLQANPREAILPDDKGIIKMTPVALSFKAGLESVEGDTRTVQIVIRDFANRVVWTANETFIAGREKTIIAPVVISGVGLGNYQYTVEINPNKNPKEIVPNVDPYKDNKASTTFTVSRNTDCFQCYDRNTEIRWVLEYTTTVYPDVPYSYRVCTSRNKKGRCRGWETRWACRTKPSYKVVNKQNVNFFEVYRFEQVLFRSKYTQDNAARMRAGGANISNDGWLDVLNLPSNLNKYVGIKSGYGFEIKVVTYYDHNFDCDRDIPGPTVQCSKPDPVRKQSPIQCWSASDTVIEKSYDGRSTGVESGGFLPGYIPAQTNDFLVCIEWPLTDDYGNPVKTKMDLTAMQGSRPQAIKRGYELPRKDSVKKGVFERKMYIHRDVAPNVVSGPTYTIKLQTNRKKGLYTPQRGRQGYLQDCFEFNLWIVGKMEEDMVTHIMD